jgi:hypothetical protein
MKRSVLTILLLIPFTLLIPAIGFGGEPPPSGTLLSLPPYIGTLTAEWQPTGTGTTCASAFWPGVNSPCGNVIIYGKLNCAEKRCKDITITKKKAVTFPTEITQEDFLSLEPTNLLFLQWSWTFPLEGPGTYFAITSANDLSYQSPTLFTVDVVVMQFK